MPALDTSESGEQPLGGSWGGSTAEKPRPATLLCGVKPSWSTTTVTHTETTYEALAGTENS